MNQCSLCGKVIRGKPKAWLFGVPVHKKCLELPKPTTAEREAKRARMRVLRDYVKEVG